MPRSLVQTDGANSGEVLLCTRLIGVVIKGTLHPHIADRQQLRHLAHRHRLTQRNQQGLQQQREAAAGTCPGNGDLGGLATGTTAYPRHLGMDVGLILEEVEVAPLAFPGVMHRLVLRPAVRAGEACPWAEGSLQRPAAGSKATAATSQGVCRPNARVNRDGEVGITGASVGALPVDVQTSPLAPTSPARLSPTTP